MGNWQLEVGKMTFYVFFPLTIFYLCNKTEYFKEGSPGKSWLGAYSKEQTPEQIKEGRQLHEEFQERMYQIAERKRMQQEAVELKMLEEKRKAFNTSSS